MRPIVGLIAVAVFGAACSASDSGGPAPSTMVSTTVAVTDVETTNVVVVDTAPPTTEAIEPLLVSIDVVAPELEVDGSLVAEVDPQNPTLVSPFDRYASCSGHQPYVAAYSVVVSDPEGHLHSVGILTDEHVEVAGIYDGSIRIETQSGAPVTALGTITLDAGLQSGTFVGFDSDSNEISGSFRCEGDTPGPVPLEHGVSSDGELEAIEVFVLLRRDNTERVVGLAVRADEVTAECGSESGSSSSTVVRIDGDLTTGGLTMFELVSGSDSTLRIRVGADVFEIEGVEFDLDPTSSSGTFSATSSTGLRVDGAFRCT